ncbi:uncharacterized protein LOC103159201 [Cricetulus griseus]|uniref:Uncharacterized protein LOC103159201 n=1 Tax=Cricetulus griseus TaxID=10029 RepID=A0A9J7F5F9_CRIGR|nr:uncharacterized protein LOC103159201 [Cricetulus griseus]
MSHISAESVSGPGLILHSRELLYDTLMLMTHMLPTEWMWRHAVAKKKHFQGCGSVREWRECLPSVHKALSSSCSIKKCDQNHNKIGIRDVFSSYADRRKKILLVNLLDVFKKALSLQLGVCEVHRLRTHQQGGKRSLCPCHFTLRVTGNDRTKLAPQIKLRKHWFWILVLLPLKSPQGGSCGPSLVEPHRFHLKCSCLPNLLIIPLLPDCGTQLPLSSSRRIMLYAPHQQNKRSSP